MQRLNIFVSYSHQDREWLERLSLHLAILERRALVYAWSDTRIAVGANWEEEIEKYLGVSKVAILLISPSFLASDFIWRKEMPLIMKHQEQGMDVLPLIVRPCAWLIEDKLKQLQAYPIDGYALSTVSEWQVDLDLAGLVYKLAAMLQKTSGTLASQELERANPKRRSAAIQNAKRKADYGDDPRLRSDNLAASFLSDLPRTWTGEYTYESSSKALTVNLAILTRTTVGFQGIISYPERKTITLIEGSAFMIGSLGLDPVLSEIASPSDFKDPIIISFRETAILSKGSLSIEPGEYRAAISGNLLSGVWLAEGRRPGGKLAMKLNLPDSPRLPRAAKNSQ